jgi:hypothetical protein
MLKVFSTLVLCFLTLAAQANDGVYFVNGNQLVPIHETNISISREVLTISISDDGYASVDVQYEFKNNGPAKTVDMGFEANAPYNASTALDPKGKHPYISDFTVTMNGQKLPYRNAVVIAKEGGNSDFRPINLKQWTVAEDIDDHLLRYEHTDSIAPFAYAYYFSAPFHAGINKVHHTYRYKMSYGVGRTFEITYWLKPAMRWANKLIDDFTLRIKAENTAKHFYFVDSLFTKGHFIFTDGMGKIRTIHRNYEGQCKEVTMRNGTLEWHATNFVPRDNINIYSADLIYSFDDKAPYGSFYDRGKNFTFWSDYNNKKIDEQVLRNLPYAHRGYVFKSSKLRRYFSKLWWYMPDPNYQPAKSDITPNEQEAIAIESEKLKAKSQK